MRRIIVALAAALALLPCASCDLFGDNDSELSLKTHTTIEARLSDWNRRSQLHVEIINTSKSGRNVALSSAVVDVLETISEDVMQCHAFDVSGITLKPGESYKRSMEIEVEEYWKVGNAYDDGLELNVKGTLLDPEGFWDPESWTWTVRGYYKKK